MSSQAGETGPPGTGAASTADADDRRRRFFSTMLGGIAATLALAGALTRPIWLDELFTLRLARLPVDRILASLVNDSGPPLHYFLAHSLWLVFRWQEGSLVGTWLVRLPSVAAYGLIVALLARPSRGERRGLPWGALVAMSWLPLLFYATEARAYAPLAAALLLLVVRGEEWLEHGARGAILWGAVAATIPLLHNTGVLYFTALAPATLLLRREVRTRAAIALGVAAIPFLAWLPTLLRQPVASVAWMTTGHPAGHAGRSTLQVLSPAGPFPALFELEAAPVPEALSVVALALLASAGLAGVVAWWRSTDPLRREKARRIAFCGIVASPAVALGLASLANLPVYFAGRTECLAWPLACASGAMLVSPLDRRLRAVLIAPFVFVGLATEASWLRDLPGHTSPPGLVVGRHLAPAFQPGDLVISSGLWEMELRSGFASAGLPTGEADRLPGWMRTFPSSLATHPGWLDPAAFAIDTLPEARALRGGAESKGVRRIWVVWSPSLPLESGFFPAFDGWTRRPFQRDRAIAVDLLLRPATATP